MARLWFIVLAACLLVSVPSRAQKGEQTEAGTPPEKAGARRTRHRKPDLKNLETVRFVTDTDYPPFNYLDEEGTLTGFNVDLARAICDELAVECDVRPLSWEELIPALAGKQADAAIASIRVSRTTLEKVDFTESYYHTPARFIGRKDNPLKTITPRGLEGRKVAVVEGTAHVAFLKDFFPGATLLPFDRAAKAKAAVKDQVADLMFGDGISLMFWLNGSTSNACCEFRGGPFVESRYFGEGVGIAVNKGNRKMRGILDYALERVRITGRYEELFLRYFPLSFF